MLTSLGKQPYTSKSMGVTHRLLEELPIMLNTGSEKQNGVWKGM